MLVTCATFVNFSRIAEMYMPNRFARTRWIMRTSGLCSSQLVRCEYVAMVLYSNLNPIDVEGLRGFQAVLSSILSQGAGCLSFV